MSHDMSHDMDLNLGRAITFAFEDQRWRGKLLPLLILSVIPGLNVLAWGGYAISAARNICRREAAALATWDEWSDVLVRGLLVLVATGLYFLPALIVGGCFLLLPLIIGARADSAGFLGVRCLAYLISLMYLLGVSVLLNAGHVAFARSDQFAGYLDLGARLGDVRRAGSRLVTLTVWQGSLVLLVMAGLATGYVVFLVCVNLVVRVGAGLTLIAVPLLLLTLAGLLVLIMLSALAYGYFIGGAGLRMATAAMRHSTADPG